MEASLDHPIPNGNTYPRRSAPRGRRMGRGVAWVSGAWPRFVGGVAPTYEIAVGRPHVADGFWPASQSPLKAMDTNSTFRAEFGARYANTVTTRSVSKASQASSYCSAENATWAMSVPSAFRR